MKIGILLTCYNCADYVDRCITPWINLMDRYNFIFACNSGMFRDYFNLGIAENNQETIEKLIKHKLDFLVTTSGRNLLDEDSSRNLSLDFLKFLSIHPVITLRCCHTDIRNLFETIFDSPELLLFQFDDQTNVVLW